MLESLKRWLPILARFLGGQSLIQLINLLTALLLLRLIPLHEYGLFVAANLFISLGSIGSDLHLSTAFNTLGARISTNKLKLSNLFASVMHIRRRLFLGVVLVIISMTPTIFGGHGWNIAVLIVVVFLIFGTIWVQQGINLRTQVFNIFQDVSGVVEPGIIGASIRLILTYFICSNWPYAVVALGVNLVATFLSSWLAKNKCARYIATFEQESEETRHELKKFILPLIPTTIFFAFQGQISLLIISIFGNAVSIAEIGALGRIGQIFSFLMIFNGFLFQPMFAREISAVRFASKFGWLLLIIVLFFAVSITSGYLAPDMWLLILGGKYQALAAEVPIVIMISASIYIAGFFNTALAARAYTENQIWNIIIPLALQVLFASINVINNTYNALLFSLTAAASTMLVQVFVFYIMMKKWKKIRNNLKLPGI